MMNRIENILTDNQKPPLDAQPPHNGGNPMRPETLDEFIGQSHLKATIRTAITSCKKRNTGFHMLLSGSPGLGKTALAKIIANEMGVRFVPVPAESVADSNSVKGLLSQLDATGHDTRGNVTGSIRPSVLFIDEVHRLPRQSQELLYACIEDRVLDIAVRDVLSGLMKPVRQWVPHFCLIAATNRPGDLTVAFRDRLRLQLRLEPYGEKDSALIARNVLTKMGLKCGNKAAALVAERGRGTPRRLIAICEQIRDIVIGKDKSSVTPSVCDQAFQTMGVDPLGLLREDVELLRHLGQNIGQPLGLQALASLMREDSHAIEENMEPYLMTRGLIARTQRGRALTEVGLEHLRRHHAFETTGRDLP